LQLFFFSFLDGIYDLKLIRGQVWSAAKDCIYIWSIKKSSPVKKIGWEKKDYCECLLEVDDYVLGGSVDGSVRVFSHKGKLKKSVKHGQIVASMLRRASLVWLGTEGPIVLCRADNLELSRKLIGHTSSVNAIQSVGPFSIWSCSSDKTVRAWNDLGECLQVLECDSKVFSLIDLDSEKLVWAGCWAQSLYVFNSETFELVQKVQSQHNDATAAFVVDKQRQVWSGSWDKTICIWRRSRAISSTIVS
jgi:WD40 repeat protein